MYSKVLLDIFFVRYAPTNAIKKYVIKSITDVHILTCPRL